MQLNHKFSFIFLALLMFASVTAGFSASVIVVPDSTELIPGQGVHFRAQLFDDNGAPVRLSQNIYRWTVVPENLGRFSDDGYFIAAKEAGAGKVFATVLWNGSRQVGEADVKIGRIPTPLVKVKIEPQFAIVPPTDTLQYKVAVVTSSGQRLELQNVRWEVKPAETGRIDKNGRFVAGNKIMAGAVIACVEVNRMVYSEQVPVIVSPKPTSVIRGVVQDEATTNGLEGAVVSVYRVDGIRWSMKIRTDADGNYVLGRLLPGKYVVNVSAPNYVPEWYDNVRHYDEASIVEVAENATQDGIDFQLTKGAAISGQVTLQEQDSPLAGVHVFAYSILTPRWKHHTLTDENGDYLIEGLISGEYKVVAASEGFFPEWYQEKDNEKDADVVVVTEPETTTDINFTLGTSTAILGIVTDAKSGAPLANAEVYGKLLNLSRIPVGIYRTRTNETGEYILQVEKAGDYILGATARGYKAQFYQDAYNLTDADPVPVTLDEHTTGIDFAMVGQGSIAGRVVSDATGEPIPGAVIQAFPEIRHISLTNWPIYFARSDSDGNYQLENMEAGKYLVKAIANNYLPEIFEDAETISEATYVEVKDSTIASGIDFDLVSGGVISGKIATANDSLPIPRAMVWVKMVRADENGNVYRNFATHTFSDERGNFAVKGLPEGEYIVWAKARSFESRFFDNVKTLLEATKVPVTPPAITENIDFYLPALERKDGLISGRVAGARVDTTGTVEIVELEGAWVLAIPVTNISRASRPVWTVTNEAGEYTLNHLRPGKYVVATWAEDYVGEFYDNVRSWRAATRIEVDTNAVVENIDFSLIAVPEGAYTIAGRIADENGNPIDHAMIYAFVEGEAAGFTMSDAEGYYAMDKLVPGSYKIQVSRVDFEDSYFGGNSVESATEVNVGEGQNATQTNIQLASATTGGVQLPAQTDLPTFYELEQNYPNPFNPTTQINYQLPADAKVTINVFNLLGQQVRTLIDKQLAAGNYSIQWDGKDQSGNVLPSGLYFYQMQATGTNGSNFNRIIKMSLVK